VPSKGASAGTGRSHGYVVRQAAVQRLFFLSPEDWTCSRARRASGGVQHWCVCLASSANGRLAGGTQNRTELAAPRPVGVNRDPFRAMRGMSARSVLPVNRRVHGNVAPEACGRLQPQAIPPHDITLRQSVLERRGPRCRGTDLHFLPAPECDDKKEVLTSAASRAVVLSAPTAPSSPDGAPLAKSALRNCSQPPPTDKNDTPCSTGKSAGIERSAQAGQRRVFRT